MLSGQFFLVPKLLVLPQLLLCFSSKNDHIFLPKIGRCGLTGMFEVWTARKPGLGVEPPARLLHLVSAGLQLGVPLMGCPYSPASLARLKESLKGHRALIPHFF